MEFASWIEVPKLQEGASLKNIIKEFSTRMIGTLKEWFITLGVVKHEQFYNLTSVDEVLRVIHSEFLGDDSLIQRERKNEFYDRKYCSFKMKDLQNHFKKMTEIYHEIGGLNHPERKNVFTASLPDEIHPEVYRLIYANNRTLEEHSLGEIQRKAITALSKYCEKHELFYQLMENRKNIQKACNKEHLKIKCKYQSCSCKKGAKKDKKHKEDDNKFSKYKKSKKNKLKFFRKKK